MMSFRRHEHIRRYEELRRVFSAMPGFFCFCRVYMLCAYAFRLRYFAYDEYCEMPSSRVVYFDIYVRAADDAAAPPDAAIFS